jgi:hypothetical protein
MLSSPKGQLNRKFKNHPVLYKQTKI